MKSPLIAAISAGAALSVMAAGATFAQAQSPAPGAPPAAAHKGHGMKRQFDPAARAQHLRETLQLTPAQEPALQAFVSAHAQRRAERQDRRAAHAAEANLTTPQRLDRMAQHMAERQRDFAQHAEVVKRFYAQLTPAQQKAFDAMHQGKGGKGKRGHRGGHDGGQHHGPGRG